MPLRHLWTGAIGLHCTTAPVGVAWGTEPVLVGLTLPSCAVRGGLRLLLFKVSSRCRPQSVCCHRQFHTATSYCRRTAIVRDACVLTQSTLWGYSKHSIATRQGHNQCGFGKKCCVCELPLLAQGGVQGLLWVGFRGARQAWTPKPLKPISMSQGRVLADLAHEPCITNHPCLVKSFVCVKAC